MGLFKRKSKLKEGVSLSDKLASIFGSRGTANADPLYNSAFWACVMNLAKTYATLPLHAYRAEPKGGAVRLDRDCYLNRLMAHPNKYMTSYWFWFVMGFNLELHGEAIALMERNPQGIVTGLYPISPSSVLKYVDNGEMYIVLGANGQKYPIKDVLDIVGTPVGFTHVLSPVQYASDAVDLDKRVKGMQSEYFHGDSIIGNIITVPRNVDDEGLARIKAMFDQASGFKNYVVKEGVKVDPLQVNSGDIGKLTDASNWSAREIARRFQVPPFFIGDTSVPMGNAEQQGLEMVTYCIGPRVKAIEIALNDALCRRNEYYKFSLQGLLRGDHASRAAFYHNAVMDGWMSHNEVRALEDLGPIEDGDTHFFPMNYATIQDIVAGKFANNGLPWDLPTEEETTHTPPHTEELTESERLAEKKRHDLAFYEAVSQPVKTSRQKLERMIRKQLKAEIAELKRLIAEGGETDAVLEEWTEWLNNYAAELQPEYKQLYIDVIKRMLPVVKDEVKSDVDVDADRIDGFAQTYSDSLMKRHAGNVQTEVKKVIGSEDFDDKVDSFQADYPIIESKEEANRSTNAFSVFLYAALGVQWMHSVARADACSFCKKLDGKVVSVDGYFLNKGADLEDGEGGIRHIKKSYRHPPYHGSCSCFVAPGK